MAKTYEDFYVLNSLHAQFLPLAVMNILWILCVENSFCINLITDDAIGSIKWFHLDVGTGYESIGALGWVGLVSL